MARGAPGVRGVRGARGVRGVLTLGAALGMVTGLVLAPGLPARAADVGAPAPEALQLTAAPRRDGTDVRLAVRSIGSATAAAAATAATAADRPAVTVVTGDGRTLQATAAVTGGGDAAVRTAVLVVDTSGSMADDGMAAARQAALGYAAAVGDAVQVGLVGFSDGPVVLTAPTTDRSALQAGIARLSARGETSLYDALTVASQLAGRQGTLVVLSDGGDTVSRTSLARATAALVDAGQLVNVIGFRTAESDQGPLEAIAAAGHGKVLRASDAESLGRAFAAAAAAVPLDVTIDVTEPGTAAVPVDVRLTIGEHDYRGSVMLPARTAASAASAGPAVVRVPAARRPGTLWLGVGGGLFAVLLGAGVAVLLWPRSPETLEARRRQLALAAYAAPGTGVTVPSPADGGMSRATLQVLSVTERLVGEGERRSGMALQLDRAGLRLLPHEWIVLRSGIVLGTAAALFLLVDPGWLGLLLGLLLGGGGTEFWLRRAQARRCRQFAEQLPDTLQLVASSLRSGFSLQQALASAQEGGTAPMSAELGRALAASRIGVPLEDELEQIAVRMRSDDWRMAVMAIRIQRSVGGNLAEVLATTGRTLRERAAVVRQVHALSAEGRLSAYVLLGLPIGVDLFLLATRREYLQPLWTTVPGVLMIAAAVVGMVVGTLWMFRTAKVEV